ncbi:MAG TPA: SUF system NifU family Fe-S cluster assembly protein [Acidimicrobiales bacterium]|nr:SUF system NifU family Fe-S cluster assembly protein [Acidimicrobiales bacterium]
MAELDELYREIILDHYRSPRNRGALESPPAHRAEGFNPLCGDEIVVYVEVADGVVANVATDGQGCSISQSSASLMSAAVKGRPLSEVRRLMAAVRAMFAVDGADESGDDQAALHAEDLGELAAMQGVVKFPARVKCATLSWTTLARSLDEADEGGEAPAR